MSRVRVSMLAVLAAIAFGLCGASSASATPVNGIAIHKVVPAADVQKTWYYRRRYYRPYYRPYYRRYYGYGPYYRPYRRYYGYYRPYRYYRPYYRRYYW